MLLSAVRDTFAAAPAAVQPDPAPDPRQVPSWVPPTTAGPRPLLGGVCRSAVRRFGRPGWTVWVIRALFCLPGPPWAVYALLWLVRLGRAPVRTGVADRLLVWTVALSCATLGFAFHNSSGVPSWTSALIALFLALPLFWWAKAPLRTWRAQFLVLAVAQLWLLAAGASVTPLDPFNGLLHLVLLYVVAARYTRAVALVVGACTVLAVLVSSAIAGLDAPLVVLLVFVVAAPLLLGDNARVRRRRPPAAVPAGAPGRSRTAPQPRAIALPRSVPLVSGLLDAAWRFPAKRPGGPLRLTGGPRRPRSGRLVGGVCKALGKDSAAATTTLRLLFAGLAVTAFLGFAVYLVLWLVLPPEDGSGEEPAADGPVTGREFTAWFLLFGIAAFVAVTAAWQVVGVFGTPLLPTVAVALLCGLPLAVVPTHPLLAWRLTAAGLLAAVVVETGLGSSTATLWPWPVSVLLVLPVVLYTLAVNYPGRVTLGAGVITVGADLLAMRVVVGTPLLQVLWVSGVAAAVLAFGYNVRIRRAAQRELAEESALRRRDLDRQAVLEERSRIARELHDVVSHHMSMIAIQAEAAPYKDPELSTDTAASFTAIRDAARDALSEMRRVVGLLREENAAAERAPQPDMDMLDDLVAGARGAGLDVELHVGPLPDRLPGSVGLSAYRIVQESLSNAGRYAAGARVEVRVEPRPGAVAVRVVNGPGGSGPPAPDLDSGGHGLVGMRERVAMLGGTLRTGALPDGGFEVAAVLPVPDS